MADAERGVEGRERREQALFTAPSPWELEGGLDGDC